MRSRVPDVRGIALQVNSEGGMLAGCSELFGALRDAATEKPLHAHVSGSAFGAAYWLTSAADHVVASPTAVVGGIGLQSVYLDDREWLEEMGLAEIVITSAQTPLKNAPPTDEDGRDDWQRTTDDLAEVMVAGIAAARGQRRDAFLALGGTGAVFVGARALAVGLVDAVGLAEEARREMLAEAETVTRAHRASTITTQQRPRNTATPRSARRASHAFDSGGCLLHAAKRRGRPPRQRRRDAKRMQSGSSRPCDASPLTYSPHPPANGDASHQPKEPHGTK